MYKGEKEILDFIVKKKKCPIEELVHATRLDADTVRRAAEALKSNGYLNIFSTESQIFVPTEEFAQYAKNGTPESKIYKRAHGGKLKVGDLTPDEKRFGLGNAKKWIKIENGFIIQTAKPQDVDNEEKKLQLAYSKLKSGTSISDNSIIEELKRRKLVEMKSTKSVIIEYTGKQAKLEESFDISVESENAFIGKEHLLSKLESKIKSTFLSMGFCEMEGSIVQSAFWNFDALFQPQDHPARELADTFYVEGKEPLPDPKLVKKVKEAHEKGWGYEWKEEEAERLVLRTHTTALSARYLSKIKKGEAKRYFSIGKVFRNEATDYKHLAEFYQIEGIISWEGATFRDLLGVLKEFYKSLGFDKIRFRPSFFPYTEPSLEIEVYFEPRKQWMELGGAGMFRPEVSIPLADTYPVLAWGLSLERPLMMLLGLEDIREFYKNDLNFLKKTRL